MTTKKPAAKEELNSYVSLDGVQLKAIEINVSNERKTNLINRFDEYRFLIGEHDVNIFIDVHSSCQLFSKDFPIDEDNSLSSILITNSLIVGGFHTGISEYSNVSINGGTYYQAKLVNKELAKDPCWDLVDLDARFSTIKDSCLPVLGKIWHSFLDNSDLMSCKNLIINNSQLYRSVVRFQGDGKVEMQGTMLMGCAITGVTNIELKGIKLSSAHLSPGTPIALVGQFSYFDFGCPKAKLQFYRIAETEYGITDTKRLWLPKPPGDWSVRIKDKDAPNEILERLKLAKEPLPESVLKYVLAAINSRVQIYELLEISDLLFTKPSNI